jgi:hypothetical protein
MLEPSLKHLPRHDRTDSSIHETDFFGDSTSGSAFYNATGPEELLDGDESTGLLTALPLPANSIDTTFPLPAIETHEPFHPRETHSRKRTITTAQLVLFT